LRATSTTEVFFEDVEIPVENRLGEPGKGFKVAMHVLNSGRLGLAGGTLGSLKAMFRESLKHVKERNQFKKNLIEFEQIRKKVAQMTIDIFAAESMVYLTTAMVDRGDVDYSLESAMCKIMATEVTWTGINECIQMVGGMGYMRENPYEKMLRDSRINMIFEGTNEILRMFVALAGIQERGEYLKKIGNALKGPIKGFGVLTDYATKWLKGRVTTERIREVHPSLDKAKVNFETWAKNTHFAAERALVHNGRKIINRELIQERLADSMMDLYAMIATISRVDTLIQKKGADKCRNEIRICITFSEQAWRRVRRNLLMIDNNNDSDMIEIAGQMAEFGQYPYNAGE
ncbi:MAG: acyl-CoA dehydrogenase, partial [Caldithrix sp.]|nr:acyl-CoA dehydrogenase [Caldithrix sp.]